MVPVFTGNHKLGLFLFYCIFPLFFSTVKLFSLYYITNPNYHYLVHYVGIHSICLTASSLIIYTLLDYHCALAWTVRMWQSNRDNGPCLRRPISPDSRVLTSGTACEAAARKLRLGRDLWSSSSTDSANFIFLSICLPGSPTSPAKASGYLTFRNAVQFASGTTTLSLIEYKTYCKPFNCVLLWAFLTAIR